MLRHGFPCLLRAAGAARPTGARAGAIPAVKRGSAVKVKKVVYLTDVPFTPRDRERLGVDFYRGEGLAAEVFGLEAIFRPVVSMLEENDPCVRHFFDLDDACAAVRSLGADTLVINLLPRSAPVLPLAAALRRTPALVAEVRTNAAPQGRRGLRRRLARLTPARARNAVARLVWPFMARRPDIIIYGGEAMRPAPHEGRRLVSAHALDYDAFSLLPSQPAEEGRRYALFVDQNLAAHPDFALLGQEAPVSAGAYYPAMRRFFASLEEHLGLPVIIAAHPRANAAETAALFGGRTVAAGRTAHLARDASLVLVHYSTALNFAILGNAPVTFVETDEMRAACGPTVRLMAELTGRPLLSADRPPREWDTRLLEVKADSYTAYARRYIKEPGSIQAPFWRILLDAARRQDAPGPLPPASPDAMPGSSAPPPEAPADPA